MSNPYKVEIKKLPKSEVEIKGEIEASLLDRARKDAIKKFSQKLDLPGFRKGHIPENVVIEKVNEDQILGEAADILLNQYYPLIISENKIDSIGRPRVSITKLASGNPLEFTVNTAVFPEYDLPDYHRVAKDALSNVKESAEEVTEKEVDLVALQIRKNKAHMDWHKANPKAEGHNHPDFDKEENLPAFDDDLAKAAGNFQNVGELREKIKENLVNEKKIRNVEKRRAAIMDALVSKTKIDLPEILIESELEKSLAQMKDQVEQIGAKFEDYLKDAKKSEDDLKEDLREGAEKKAKIQLIFNKIAEAEKIEPNKEILDHEVKQIIEHYPSARPENARIYVATQLINQEVLKLLEGK